MRLRDETNLRTGTEIRSPTPSRATIAAEAFLSLDRVGLLKKRKIVFRPICGALRTISTENNQNHTGNTKNTEELIRWNES